MTDQQGLSLLSQHWGHRYTPPHLAFDIGAGSWTQVPTLAQRAHRIKTTSIAPVILFQIMLLKQSIYLWMLLDLGVTLDDCSEMGPCPGQNGGCQSPGVSHGPYWSSLPSKTLVILFIPPSISSTPPHPCTGIFFGRNEAIMLMHLLFWCIPGLHLPCCV